MPTLFHLIAETTKVVADLDRICEAAAKLAVLDAEARIEAEILRDTADRVREHMIEALDQVNPLPILR